MVMKMDRKDEEKEKKLGVGDSLLDTIDFIRFNGLDFDKMIKWLKFKILLKSMVDHHVYWFTLDSHMPHIHRLKFFSQILTEGTKMTNGYVFKGLK